MPSDTPAPGSVKIKQVFVGLDDFYKTIEGLPLDMQTSIIATAVGEAVKPLVRLAKQFAPVRTGALRASISSKVIRQRQKGTAAAIMGPAKGHFRGKVAVKKGASREGAEQPARYAHLVEFGHDTSNGHIPARPFMRPATAAGSEQVARSMTVGIQKGMMKALKKYKKGNL